MTELFQAPDVLNAAGRAFVRQVIIAELKSWNDGRTFQQLWRVVNEKLGYDRGDSNSPGYRATDYQLQVLRRSGEIHFKRFGRKTCWFINKEEPHE